MENMLETVSVDNLTRLADEVEIGGLDPKQKYDLNVRIHQEIWPLTNKFQYLDVADVSWECGDDQSENHDARYYVLHFVQSVDTVLMLAETYLSGRLNYSWNITNEENFWKCSILSKTEDKIISGKSEHMSNAMLAAVLRSIASIAK